MPTLAFCSLAQSMLLVSKHACFMLLHVFCVCVWCVSVCCGVCVCVFSYVFVYGSVYIYVYVCEYVYVFGKGETAAAQHNLPLLLAVVYIAAIGHLFLDIV